MNRRPVAAGTHYPADPTALASTVDALLDAADRRDVADLCGVIAPHAGYSYSGAVAASAFGLVRGVDRIVLLGPSHFVPLTGLAVSSADAWSTPLGDVRVGSSLRNKALAAGAFVDDEPHAEDHALEVELPFLQRTCPPDLEILPVAVGSTATLDVVRLIDALEAFVVVSTDLSHQLPEESARRRDRETAEAVMRHETHAIREGDACGGFALRGMVEHARERGLRIELLDLRTSANSTGDGASVVGYGAFAVRRGGA